MRFTLVDRIVHLEKGARISTVKALALSEEYLADHFPRFPVLPGVLMLEAMTQASAWLLRITDDFSHSIITLKQARNIRFKTFVSPGQLLSISATILRRADNETHLDVNGSVDGSLAVSGRLILEQRNLADDRPENARTDEYVKRSLRNQLPLLYRAPAEQLANPPRTYPTTGVGV